MLTAANVLDSRHTLMTFAAAIQRTILSPCRHLAPVGRACSLLDSPLGCTVQTVRGERSRETQPVSYYTGLCSTRVSAISLCPPTRTTLSFYSVVESPMR